MVASIAFVVSLRGLCGRDGAIVPRLAGNFTPNECSLKAEYVVIDSLAYSIDARMMAQCQGLGPLFGVWGKREMPNSLKSR